MKKNYFQNKYFEKRNFNDPKGLAIFDQEIKILKKYKNFKSRVLDLGCSTGESLDYLNWKGQKYVLHNW